ncbi:MAG: DUF6495 family protein [Cytophagaceae bacterium]
MTIYRRLTLEELQLLEKEFVQFLVVQGIEADQWVKLKEERLSEANQLIDNFSDMVLETSLKKISFLELRTAKKIHAYQCLSDKLVLVAMEADENSAVDFTDTVKVLSYMTVHPESLRVYTNSRAYNTSREIDLFNLTEMGCLISDGKIFKSLSMLL